ncbi:MAG: molecular chaperone HtpG [Candidatus Sericytochromatia bacterium]|nr:molecular chaperone HtpG [Candidatus Tanganyikabacteria bacterium]
MSNDSVPMEQGRLSIHAENLLPIIKKWLYSEKEIFLRELVANAFDATTKARHVALVEGLGDLGSLAIDILFDKDAGTVTIRDEGIGMTADEIRNYLTQVAFSGAQAFVEKYELRGDGQGIIGHFGLGFYSAFMVARKVEVHSRGILEPDGAGTRWVSDGGMTFEMGPEPRATRGTDVVLHLDDVSGEFLEEIRLAHLVRRYANYLPLPIRVGGKEINHQAPLWTRSPQGLADEDYKAFYDKAFPFQGDPLFWVHLNTDYPFRLQGILYFPRLRHELDVSKGEVQLYCNQVFVADHSEAVIPKFLTILKGMIDCPDLPLNVSRSALQNDPYVRKIAQHIVRKVADRLVSLHKDDRAAFEAAWADIHPFIKFGFMEDERFYEACKDVLLFRTTDGTWLSPQDWLGQYGEKTQGKLVYVLGEDLKGTTRSLLEDKGIHAVHLEGPFDVHFIQFLEGKNPERRWVRADAVLGDLLARETEDAGVVDAEGKTRDVRIAELFQGALGEAAPGVKVVSLDAAEVSALLVSDEEGRRMQQFASLWGQDDRAGQERTLLVNRDHPLVQRALDAQAETGQKLCRHVYDLARLAVGDLPPYDLQAFIKRAQDLIR